MTLLEAQQQLQYYKEQFYSIPNPPQNTDQHNALQRLNANILYLESMIKDHTAIQARQQQPMSVYNSNDIGSG